MIFESHAHYDDSKFTDDQQEVLFSLKGAGVGRVINVAADMESSYASVELAKKYDFIYAAVGVHPHDVKSMMEEDLEKLIALAAYEKVVAIGEIGLDYYYDYSPKEVQRLWFREQIILAKELELPIIVHSRDAAQETFDLIMELGADSVGGVIHCYSGSKEMAKIYTDKGFYLGIGGVITYDNAKILKEVVREIPIERLLIETDCPYLSPVPNRGKRNDSKNLTYVVDAIAKIKQISAEEVVSITYNNATQLFQTK
ncbi:MAG: TatD family hydrolase [Vallitaleaceae bacterium]|nr:TatD family hydrolase [Vallitaleaceae bacterium]